MPAKPSIKQEEDVDEQVIKTSFLIHLSLLIQRNLFLKNLKQTSSFWIFGNHQPILTTIAEQNKISATLLRSIREMSLQDKLLLSKLETDRLIQRITTF